MARLPPIVCFAAPSNTGKTTLIEGVVRALVARGLRVGVLKADAHRVVLDTPGKDSWRFAEAGAAQVAVMSEARLALFERLDGGVSLVAAVDRLFPGAQIVLAEGFRRSGLPSVRVHRAGGPSTEGWDPPLNPVAWASDGPVQTSLPVLPLGDPAAVADWIVATYVRPPAPRRPTLVCAAGQGSEVAEVAADAARLAALLGAPALVVSAAGPTSAAVPVVGDLRPGLGLLGALLTALAAVDTPEILLVGPRHRAAPAALLRGLIAAAPGADVVTPRVAGHPEPALALYTHRCLSPIQAALIGGERRLTGWWGAVRAEVIPPEIWRPWDPAGLAFPELVQGG